MRSCSRGCGLEERGQSSSAPPPPTSAAARAPPPQDLILSDLGFVTNCTMWTDFVFVASGIAAGLALGFHATEPGTVRTL